MADSPLTTDDIGARAKRSDPIGDKYFRPLRIADTMIDCLFWFAALLSFALIFIPKEKLPHWYDISNILFILVVLVIFTIGIVCRLHLSPRAEDARRKDLFTNSFKVDLTHETTTGYYNNDETNPFRRLALSVMESSFFTSRVCQAMLLRVRTVTAIYLGAWLSLVLIRETDLGLITVAAQALFSEILISKWLRLEWLSRRSDEVNTLFGQLLRNANTFNKGLFHAQAVEHASFYETSKSSAGIVLSDAVFTKLNPALSAEWEQILKTLPPSAKSPRISRP
jgi:hypothetical protein